jgi:hypothetical protein
LGRAPSVAVEPLKGAPEEALEQKQEQMQFIHE